MHCLPTRRTTQTHSSTPSPSEESLQSSRPRPTARPRQRAILRSTANVTLSNGSSISSNTSVPSPHVMTCLLYTSDAADDLLCVDLGGRRIIKKKKHLAVHEQAVD